MRSEHDKEYDRQYYRQNREKILERNKQWRKDNPERAKEIRRRYFERNKDKIRERGRKNWAKNKGNLWKDRNPEKAKEIQQRHNERNKDKIKERNREASRRLRRQIIELMGGKCVVCGIDDFRVLQIDHIHGGGMEEYRKLSSEGIYRKIRDNPHLIGVEYQLLCANHNQMRRYENW